MILEIMTKKIFISLVFALICAVSSAQIPAFESFTRDRHVTYLYISGGILSMTDDVVISGLSQDADIHGIIHKLDAVQIVRAEGNRQSDRTAAAVRRIIRRERYSLFMQLNDAGSEVEIYQGKYGDSVVILMCVRDGPKYSAIAFSGSLTAEEIVKLARGANH